YEEKGEAQAHSDFIKQVGFYTDGYPGDPAGVYWSAPSEWITEDIARSFLKQAELTLQKVLTVRELELWIEHVVQHLGTDASREAVIEYYRALKSEGFSTKSIEEIESFYRKSMDGPKAGGALS